ncbi:MAG: hypothetical protein AAFY59_19285, partial [Pseudomonadota bacterium]
MANTEKTAQKKQPAQGSGGQLPQYVDPKGRKIMPRHRKMAMRRVRELGLEFSSPNEALHLAAENGINVFANDESILDIARTDEPAPKKPQNQLVKAKGTDVAPKADPGASVMRAPDEDNALATVNKMDEERERREKEVARIQRDLVRRRRARLWAMMLRLIVFVFLPTYVVGYYYVFVATDMYETNSQFVIQTTENPAAGGGLSGLLAGTGLATAQDSTVVQG